MGVNFASDTAMSEVEKVLPEIKSLGYYPRLLISGNTFSTSDIAVLLARLKWVLLPFGALKRYRVT